MGRTFAIGYGSLILLLLALPFDMRYHPLLHDGLISVTNVSILAYVVTVLALAALRPTFTAFVRNAAAGIYDPTNLMDRQRVPVLFFVAFLLSSTISGLLAGKFDATLQWTLELLVGGLLWLAVPLWLAPEPDARARRVGMAIVAGAVIAGLIGFCEILLGPNFDHNLAWFKDNATKVGPYLRLSSTFTHANLAALCFGIALPFAIAGLASELMPRSHRWWRIVAWLAAIDVLLAAFLLTYSRGGLVGLACGMTAMAVATRGHWHLSRHVRDRRLALFISVNIVVVVGAFALSSSSVEALRLSSVSDRDWYGAAYRSSLPATMTAGRTLTVRVVVENQSPVAWRARGAPASRVRLSYHWLYSTMQMERLEGARTSLSSDVAPGRKDTILARVRAPGVPGKYFLVWDLVLGNGTWFSLRSASYNALPVRVIARSGDPAARLALKLPNTAAPTRLPAAPPPDREQIWPVALRMIEAHPLFGVGPYGVWLNYASFARTPVSVYAAHSPGHAHSLYLEIFADFGLVGGVLFFAWFLTAWRSLLVGAWQGQMGSAWQVAVLGATAMILGNGLVDYTLQTLSLFMMFCVLGGLAATAGESGTPAHA